MPNSDLEAYLKDLEAQTKNIKDEIFRISWYMRGGVSSEDLFHTYTYDEILEIMSTSEWMDPINHK